MARLGPTMVRDCMRRYGLAVALNAVVGGVFVLADVLRFGMSAQPVDLALSVVLFGVTCGLVNYRYASGPAPRREIDVLALLGREEVRLDVAACAHYLEGRVVLVTGAAGSIGSELCRQLVHLRPGRLILLDQDETGLSGLYASLQALHPAGDLVLCMVNIAIEERMQRVFADYRPQVVFHAAAYKHVDVLEEHPVETVTVNVHGTALLCRTARASGVERFVFVSSDKAVDASSNLGYSKRIGELLVRAYGHDGSTIFCAVRFGNVLGSRGSVVPRFEGQIATGGPITVRHRDVTRFFMSIPEAACLVIRAAVDAPNGSIFVLDMGRPVPIVALAEKMIRLHGLRVGKDVQIIFTGLHPGEKLHEALTSAWEAIQPTGHAKIMKVVDLDPRPACRVALEEAEQTLLALTRRAVAAEVSAALCLASRGCPIAGLARRTGGTERTVRAGAPGRTLPGRSRDSGDGVAGTAGARAECCWHDRALDCRTSGAPRMSVAEAE